MNDLFNFFKSVLDQDQAPVVICNLNHEIIYMNPKACENYSSSGGMKLLGQSLKNCHNEQSGLLIDKVIDWFKKSSDNNIVYTYKNEKQNKDVYMVALRDENKKLIGYYEKHEMRNIESKKLYDIK